MATHEIRLPGCRPVPLASYLKGLAVLRLVAKQADPDARGCYEGDVFVLHSKLDEDALLAFFLESYRPSPIVSPWNGGSGFYQDGSPKALKTLQAIRRAEGDRYRQYREAVLAADHTMEMQGITSKPTEHEKLTLLLACRANLPDDALPWLDAAMVLTREGPRYPPILGTGGNDGNLDFSNNFMQRLLDVLDPDSDAAQPRSAERLRTSLFGEAAPGGLDKAIGQFLPGDAGGANSGSGFEGRATVAPWDFVLMIEGSLVFASATVRRLGSAARDALAAPFTVRSASVGYGNAAEAEDSRGEIWLPVWERPAGAAEVAALFSEGRAHVGRRPTRDGVDFARAVASLGVDRGIASFQRYGLHVRNGRSYFATPLTRMQVRARVSSGLIDEIDPWFESFRRRTDLPGSIARAVRGGERAILDACRSDDSSRVQALLVALGRLQAALGRSLDFTLGKWIRPAPLLSSRWLLRSADGSAEFRLAAALAATCRYEKGRWHRPMREQVEPVEVHPGWVSWRKNAGRDVVPESGVAVRWLNRIFARRLLDAVRDGLPSWSDRSRISAGVTDLAAFQEGRTDDGKLIDLFRALILIDWRKVERSHLPAQGRSRSPHPDALFALMKLCFAGRPVHEVDIPLVPQIHVRAARGDGFGATRLAARRLRGSGLTPPIESVHSTGDGVGRAAAALLFPLGEQETGELARLILPRPEEITAESGGEGE